MKAPKIQKDTLRKVLRYIRPYWALVGISILLAAVTVAASLYIPILTGGAVDLIVGPGNVDFAGILQILLQIGAVIGVAALSQAVRRCLALGAEQDASAAMLSNARQQQAVLRAQQALAEASAALAVGQEPDLVAIDVENALSALGEISGRSASEQVLEEIFSRFCLGK